MSQHVWEKSYPPGVAWDASLPAAVPIESLLQTAAAQWPACATSRTSSTPR